MKTKKEWALYHAANGFWVFRIRVNGKLPMDKGWQLQATRDPVEIERLWTEQPNANVGAYTEKYMDDEALIGVDVDNKNGKDGDGTIIDLEMNGFDFPTTATNTTPTNGKHFLYRCKSPVKQGANVLGEGLDIRSHGGYVVMAGSTTDLGMYVYSPHEVAAAPAWLFSRLALATTTRNKKPVDTSKVDPERAYQRAVAYLEDAPVAETGGRNDTGFRVACELKDRGVTQDVCLELMAQWNDTLPEPMEISEIELLTGSAYENSQEEVGSKAPEAIFTPVVPTDTAKKKGTHPVDKLNDEYALVIAGGGHHVIWETTDADNRPIVEHLAEPTFHKLLAHKTITLSKKPESLSKMWMSDSKRRTYQGMTYAPGRELNGRFYNLWKGWAHLPYAEGEEIPALAQRGFDMWLDHSLNGVAGGNIEHFNWLMARTAHMFQHPEKKALTSITLKGGKGVGKNSWVEPIVALFGVHSLIADDRRYLTSNFNSFMESCSLLVLDEAAWPGDKEAEGRLKGIITGTHHNIERKGMEPYKVPNLTNLITMGNEDWLVPATADERRFAVFEVLGIRKQDIKFFSTMDAGMKAGGYRLLMEYLLNFDITPYNVNVAPVTRDLIEQKHASLEVFEQFLLDCLHTNSLINAPRPDIKLDVIPVAAFRDALVAYTRSRNIRGRLPDERKVTKLLAKILPSVRKQMVRYGIQNEYCYITPGIAQLRRDWEKYIGATDGMDWESYHEQTGELECLM